MGLSCGQSTIKYLLFIFNLLCLFSGIALAVLGGGLLIHMMEMQEIDDEYKIAVVSLLLIIIGSIVFIISFFGCCGAIRESYCMISIYSFFLILLVVAQIVIAVQVFMFVDDVTTKSQFSFENIFRDHERNGLLDLIQRNLKCCGKNSVLDYGLLFPDSCCKVGASAPLCIPFTQGCLSRLEEFLDTSGNIIAWVLLGVSGIELLSLILGCCMSNAIRNRQRRSTCEMH